MTPPPTFTSGKSRFWQTFDLIPNPPKVLDGPHGATFEVRVVPNAPRCELTQASDRSIRARFDAPPIEGAANARLIRYLSREQFGNLPSAVRVLRGETGRRKTIAVDLPAAQVAAALQQAIVASG